MTNLEKKHALVLEALRAGRTLTIETTWYGRTAVITVGPYKTATGPSQYGAFRYGQPGECISSDPSEVAWWVSDSVSSVTDIRTALARTKG